MDNLHSIIESGQRQLEEERQGSEALRNDMEAMERQLAASTKSMEKLAMALDERQEKVDELEAALEQTGRSLRSKEDEVSSLLQTQLLAQGSSHTTELLQEKHELERQLEKITKDMAGVEKVVTEMTRSFKHQVQVKEGEARAERERAETLSQMNAQLEQRCSQLEAAQEEERQREEGSMMMVEGGRLSGSVEDLSRQLQHELDLSSELDNSLLSQVAAMDTSSSSGLSEVQRLLKKIQNDGIKVLSEHSEKCKKFLEISTNVFLLQSIMSSHPPWDIGTAFSTFLKTFRKSGSFIYRDRIMHNTKR
jgi:chromosome segregation ATPase